MFVQLRDSEQITKNGNKTESHHQRVRTLRNTQNQRELGKREEHIQEGAGERLQRRTDNSGNTSDLRQSRPNRTQSVERTQSFGKSISYSSMLCCFGYFHVHYVIELHCLVDPIRRYQI